MQADGGHRDGHRRHGSVGARYCTAASADHASASHYEHDRYNYSETGNEPSAEEISHETACSQKAAHHPGAATRASCPDC